MPQGTFVHGTVFTLEKFESIIKNGIISDDFLEIPEDGETFYCADFFRVPTDQSVADYLELCNEPITTGRLQQRKVKQITYR